VHIGGGPQQRDRVLDGGTLEQRAVDVEEQEERQRGSAISG
jgi:hypothetical protein